MRDMNRRVLYLRENKFLSPGFGQFNKKEAI
jgi:hypothetical protein